MVEDEEDDDRSPYLLVRAMRSTVGRESTTFGFSILVTVVFGLVQAAHGSPRVPQIFGYAAGAVLSFSLLEGVLSSGFRRPMPQHHSQTLALGTSMNLVSVLGGAAAALGIVHLLHGWWVWATAPLVAGTVYLLLESGAAALAERLLKRAGDRDADEVDS
jgi:hypothetical protein